MALATEEKKDTVVSPNCSSCCSPVPHLNTLTRVTQCVHPHLYRYKYRCNPQGERTACATVFNYPAMYRQPHSHLGRRV